MKITAYSLHDHAVVVRPGAGERGTVHGLGWELLCPGAFEATWNGGPAPEDTTIRFDATSPGGPAFARSQDGGGLLTFHAGYQVQTEGSARLWARGPINRPKDGLCALEHVLDTSFLPGTVTITWQFTRPNQTVRFERDEPFGVLLPHPDLHAQPYTIDVLKPGEAQAILAQELLQRIQAPAMRDIFDRLRAAHGPPAPAAPAASAASRWAAQLTEPPPVSCICPTFARVELLEEAIASFLQQDYPGKKELIILNDYAPQTLVFDHPEVRVINVARRFTSVGEKYQAAVGLCAHDLIFVWHDDDISLPHRLSLSVAQFKQQRGFFKASQLLRWNSGQLSGPEGNSLHGASCFSRGLFAAARGYPPVSDGYDLGFELACEDIHTGATRGQPLAPEDLYYIYRWTGTGSYHLSAAGPDGGAYDAVLVYVQQQAERGRIPAGTITLTPRWRSDYAALVREHLQSAPEEAAAKAAFPPPYFVIPGPAPMDEAAASALFKDTHPFRISVILPSLNESVLLQRTFEQFQATLPPRCEIIVVDNGSTDGCADFLVGCQQEGVTLIQSPKPLGVAGARNRGLAAARGEVIVFADSHVDIPERWWQPIVATLNQPGVGVVGPGIGVMGKLEEKVTCGQRIAEPNLRVEWLPWKQKAPHQVPTLGGGFMAMRHETLLQAGAFDDGMPQWGSEDLELCLRYWLLGYEVWVVPEVVILHYFRSENPLKVKPGIVTHNQLRVALLHLSPTRIGKAVSALKREAEFGAAVAHAVDSDAWRRRAELVGRRVRDDDWFCEKFKEVCNI